MTLTWVIQIAGRQGAGGTSAGCPMHRDTMDPGLDGWRRKCARGAAHLVDVHGAGAELSSGLKTGAWLLSGPKTPTAITAAKTAAAIKASRQRTLDEPGTDLVKGRGEDFMASISRGDAKAMRLVAKTVRDALALGEPHCATGGCREASSASVSSAETMVNANSRQRL